MTGRCNESRWQTSSKRRAGRCARARSTDMSRHVRAAQRARLEQRDTTAGRRRAAVVAVVAALAAQFGGVPQAQALVGLVVILAIAYVWSSNRRAIDLRTVVWGLVLQITVRADRAQDRRRPVDVSSSSATPITQLLDFAVVGSSFVFGPLGDKAVWRRDHDARARRGGRGARRHLRLPACCRRSSSSPRCSRSSTTSASCSWSCGSSRS